MWSRWLWLVTIPFAVAAQGNDCPLERQVSLVIQSGPAPSLPGQPVHFTAFVAPVAGTADPTGTIQLFDGTNSLGTFPVVVGQASTVETFYSAGAREINAIYSGDFNYCGAYAAYGQPVDRLTPSVALSSSAAAVPYGAPLTLIAKVTPDPPAGVAAPAGPMQFFEGTTLLGTVTLNNGTAMFTISNLDAGSHQITATLVGDPNWYSVRSTPLAQGINRAVTATVLAAAAGASQVTLTATVTAAAPSTAVPAGSVQFTDTTAGTVLGTTALAASAASIMVSNAAIALTAGHPISATYSGGSNFIASTSNAVEIPGVANAAGAVSTNYAADEIVSLFGTNLSLTPMPLPGVPPLPTTLGGTSVTITDSAGTARQAGLYLVSAQQINFVVPSDSVTGPATITVATAGVIPLRVNLAAVAPGIFGPSAQILRVAADGSQTLETVTASTPIAIGSGTVYLVLYGTGIRNRSSLAGVTATIGTASLPVAYAGAQGQFPGLDQVNVLLPATLAGAGKVNVTLTADGQVSNPLVLNFQ